MGVSGQPAFDAIAGWSQTRYQRTCAPGRTRWPSRPSRHRLVARKSPVATGSNWRERGLAAFAVDSPQRPCSSRRKPAYRRGCGLTQSARSGSCRCPQKSSHGPPTNGGVQAIHLRATLTRPGHGPTLTAGSFPTGQLHRCDVAPTTARRWNNCAAPSLARHWIGQGLRCGVHICTSLSRSTRSSRPVHVAMQHDSLDRREHDKPHRSMGTHLAWIHRACLAEVGRLKPMSSSPATVPHRSACRIPS